MTQAAPIYSKRNKLSGQRKVLSLCGSYTSVDVDFENMYQIY
jgi:hypothetical protein